jgi:hypothetical protein
LLSIQPNKWPSETNFTFTLIEKAELVGLEIPEPIWVQNLYSKRERKNFLHQQRAREKAVSPTSTYNVEMRQRAA